MVFEFFVCGPPPKREKKGKKGKKREKKGKKGKKGEKKGKKGKKREKKGKFKVGVLIFPIF